MSFCSMLFVIYLFIYFIHSLPKNRRCFLFLYLFLQLSLLEPFPLPCHFLVATVGGAWIKWGGILFRPRGRGKQPGGRCADYREKHAAL